eukprot:gb/GECG01014483.1/.p1 GENE.gb/GECG01014483.1/~~gb/GECG01014483.1/.p1  ORF type:complete len:2079 (+),score=265.95 gb/GECG01014483.1/:1-6237(+)
MAFVTSASEDTRSLTEDIAGSDSIFNEFGLVFDDDEAETFRDIFLGFGIPWLLLSVVAALPFIFKVPRFRRIIPWVYTNSMCLHPAIQYITLVLATVLSLATAVAWGITTASSVEPTIIGIYVLILIPSIMLISYTVLRQMRTGYRLSTVRTQGLAELQQEFERTLQSSPTRNATPRAEGESASALTIYVAQPWRATVNYFKNIGISGITAVVTVTALWIFQFIVLFRGNGVFDERSNEFKFQYSYVAASWIFLGINSFFMLLYFYRHHEFGQVFSILDVLVEAVKVQFKDGGKGDENIGDTFVARLGLTNDVDEYSPPKKQKANSDLFSWICYTSPSDVQEGRLYRYISPWYGLSLLVLVVYIVINFFEAEDSIFSGRYLGFTTSSAIVLFDIIIMLSQRVRVLTSLKQLVFATLLSRFGVIAFGARFWLLGISFVYLVLGLYLAHLAGRQAFQNLRRNMEKSDTKTRNNVRKLLASTFGTDRTKSVTPESASENEANEERKWYHFRLTTAAEVLVVATLLFGGLITLFAFVMESSDNLPNNEVFVIDQAHEQWTFAIAAAGLVLAYIPVYMTVQSIRSRLKATPDAATIQGRLMTVTVGASALLVLLVGMLIFIPTGSMVVVGITAFLPSALISAGLLYLNLREQDFDLLLEGGLGWKTVLKKSKALFTCCKSTVNMDDSVKKNWKNLFLGLSFFVLLASMGAVIAEGLSPRWIGWSVSMVIAALVLTSYATMHYIYTLEFHWFQVGCGALALFFHVALHAVVFNLEKGSENRLVATVITFVGFMAILGLTVSGIFWYDVRQRQRPGRYIWAGIGVSGLLLLGCIILGMSIFGDFRITVSVLVVFFLVAMSFATLHHYKSNSNYIFPSWRRVWKGILAAIVIGCITMTVVDVVAFDNHVAGVAWISVPYLLGAFLLFAYGVYFVYSHRLWSDENDGTTTYITLLTTSSPFVYSDSSSGGLSVSVQPQLLVFVSVLMVIAWSMAIVVFISPAYAGVIVLVIAQVGYFWYQLDIQWSCNYRFFKSCEALHNTSGSLASTLLEQMEGEQANGGKSDFEPATATVLRSLQGGLWRIFQDSISETAARVQHNLHSFKKDETEDVETVSVSEAWNTLLTLPQECLSGETSFRKQTGQFRDILWSRLGKYLLRVLSCGKCGTSLPPAPEESRLEKLKDVDDNTSVANEKWIVALASLERSIVSRGFLADTLIKTDWTKFLQWSVETSALSLTDQASSQTISTLRKAWSLITGRRLPSADPSTPRTPRDTDDDGVRDAEGVQDVENPSLTMTNALRVSHKAAERKDSLISEIFTKYGTQVGKHFYEDLQQLYSAYREWQKQRLEEEKRRKQECDEAERRRKEIERKRREEAERRKQEEAERLRKQREQEEQERKRRLEEARRKREEEERHRKAEEEERRRQERERLRREEEERKRRQEEEEKRRREIEERHRREEEERKRRDEEARRKAERERQDEERRKREEEERERQRKEEEEIRKEELREWRRQEEERKRREEEELERRRREKEEREREEERRQQEEEERRRREEQEETERERREKELREKLKPDSDEVDQVAYEQMMRKFQQIQDRYNETGERFIDTEFDGGEALGPGILEKASVHDEWQRPEHFAISPALNPRGNHWDPDDVKQGILGDCWLLAAFSVAALHPEILNEVFVTKEYNPAGAYVVKFFKNGLWTPVLVDDRVPVYGDRYYPRDNPEKLYAGQFTGRDKLAYPLFVFSRNYSSLWSMLLEKAYAKFYGQYEVIEGGHVCTALVDITGGHGSNMELNTSSVKQEVMDGSLWEKLMNFYRNGYLMGCGSHAGKDTNVSSKGIVYGHAYSILKLVEGADQFGTHHLLQLRNPHGKTEWNGKWGDKDKKSWTKRMKRITGYDPQGADGDDGTFWMSFQDFTEHFATLYIVRRFKSASEEGGWHRYVMHGGWKRGSTAGGCVNYPETCWTNPHYLIKPSAPTTIFVNLAQKESASSGRDFEAIAPMLVKNGVKRIRKLFVGQAVAKTTFMPTREVTLEVDIKPSDEPYVLFVSTFEPDIEREYVLRVYSRAPLLDTETDSSTGKEKLPQLPSDHPTT